MFDDLVDKLVALVQAVLQQIKDYIQANPDEAKDRILEGLHNLDSALHNFIDDVEAYEPPPPAEAPAPTQHKKK